MPELPDVETFKRYLDATALHQPVAGVRIGAPRLLRGLPPQALGQRLRRRSLESTRRHGKWLFARAGGAGWLVLHFGMSGRLQYAKSAAALPPHPELLLRFANGAGLAYLAPRKLGRIDWTPDPDAYVADHAPGPDALALGRVGFRQRARGRRGGVKAWLMDQRALAGIGNLYSDEILFQAGIHPRRAVADLDEAALGRLYRAMRRVLREAIAAGADPRAMPANFLLRERSPGGRCPRCGEALATTRAAGRTAWYCPRCQVAEAAAEGRPQR